MFLVHSFLQDWYGNLRTKILASVPCPSCISAFYCKGSSLKRPSAVGAFPLQSVLQAYMEKPDGPLACPQCKIRASLHSVCVY